MQNIIKAFIYKGDTHYVAECLNLGVVTQGKTIDETVENLQEAISLHLDGENLSDFDLSSNPTLLVTLELEPTICVA